MSLAASSETISNRAAVMKLIPLVIYCYIRVCAREHTNDSYLQIMGFSFAFFTNSLEPEENDTELEQVNEAYEA